MKTLIPFLTLLVMIGNAVQLHSQSAETYMKKGNEEFLKQEYENAIKSYSKAIELNPKSAGAHTKRGNSYSVLKKYDEAIVDYSMAISIDNKYGEAYYGRGMARLLKGSKQPNYCDDFMKAKKCGYSEAKKAIKEYCK